MTKRSIVKGINDEYYFFDDLEDYEIDENVIGYVEVEKQIGYHRCIKSELWDDTTGFIDIIQDELDLPDVMYLVTYYVCDENYDLRQFVDVGIDKKEIITNIVNQKYREGAEYFRMNQLIKES